MTTELAIEALMAVLLAVTVTYCYLLNRRLTALRAEQESLSDLIVGLNQATARAQDGVFQLRAASQETEESLKREIGRGRALADELALITEAGGNLADRIETGLGAARRAPTHTASANPALSSTPPYPVKPPRKSQHPNEARSSEEKAGPKASRNVETFPVKEVPDDIRAALRAAR